MKDLQEKYARVLLEFCLKIKKGQPLFISFDIERFDFVRIVTKIAYKLGVTDIYYDIVDLYIKHEALLNLNLEELKSTGLWNKQKWNTYAKKGAAFLMLASEVPDLMNDIDSKKLSSITKYSLKTRKVFDELRNKSLVPWTIAIVPTYEWAKKVFPNSSKPVEDFWINIFEICGINEKDPIKYWENKLDVINKRTSILNSLQLKELKYSSSNGTSFSIKLPNNHKWCSGKEILKDKREIIVNFPTEEVFTSPDCKSANGIVYSTKPLCYQDNIINDFYLEFKNGKVIKSYAKVGNNLLKEMVSICKNSDMLGELALVPYNSSISNKNIIFYETLYDENASCHLALGDSFLECISNNISKKDAMKKYNLNDCKSHIDFMIGNKDMNIIGITKDNKRVEIFENGNFTRLFK